MFETFIQVPRTIDEARLNMTVFGQIHEKIAAVTDTNKYRVNWNTDYGLSSIGYVLTALTAIALEDGRKFVITYTDNDQYGFKRQYEGDTDRFGIYINREASTHFNETDYPNATYLSNAEEFLKQSPHHYLRLLTSPYNHKLYVWTNKTLTPDNLYKLFALEAALHPRENKIAENFTNMLIEGNAEGARKIVVDFLTSDAIKDLEFEKFRKCLSSSNDAKINQLRNIIDNRRSCIKDYEDQISIYAAEIREKTEEIMFLRGRDITDEQKLFFKHLNKIPYITRFEGNEDGYIKFWYEAPLIYFADYPAEKLLKTSYATDFYKNVIKMIIGRKYQLWTKCVLLFDTSRFTLQNAAGRSDGPANLLPHPHISRFNCFGNHRHAIAESAEAGDYIGAIEQTTQAVLNLNFYDSCVIDALVNALNDKKNTLATWKCVETGEMLTTEEVLERNDYYEET